MSLDEKTEKVNSLYKKATQFRDWCVEELIRKRNWSALLILLAVLVFVLFNPFQLPFTNLLAVFTQLKEFNWYAPVFWSSLAIMFAAAVAVAARAKKQVIEGPRQKLSAIKALLPFGHNEDDIAIFARLQREQNLDECLQAMSDPHWRFGLICGESGAGKTSFLQAGLWPALEGQKYRCVYVKFSDLDPFQSVEQACVKELSLPKEAVNGDGLLSVIRKATTQDATTVVLIFDQFEQFFVHCKRKKDRKPFVQELTDWYNREQSLPVKILISIRGDFFYRLNELQEAMKYSLSPAQSFRLERFEPPQAAEIFCAIAEKESLDFNRSFINEVTRQELADSDDGLISPVDIQVLAWMVAGQSDKENRAFNRTTFQKLGGVEGLLERYLTRALDVRETESRRQAAIKVMLGLTDLERNTRAGALTISALREKLKDDLSDAELKEAVTWLSRSDVRLIAPLTENQEEKFELAHERIIPAVRKLANKTLEPVARVNQLLDSRVNEWIGNGRNSRYLFSPSELRLIRKQKSFITWGKNRSIKDDLIAASKKRLKIRFALACLTILLFTGGWFIWSTNRVQLYLMKSDLKDYGLRLNGDATLGEIAKAFYVSGDFQLASQILDRIENDSSKATALGSISVAFIKLGDKDRTLTFLNYSLKLIEKFNKDSYKADVLRLIAAAATKLEDKDRVLPLLNDSLKLIDKINEDSYKVTVLGSIAEAFIKLEDKDHALLLLNDSLKFIDKINDDYYKAMGLSLTAEAFIKLGDKDRALLLLNDALKLIDKINEDSSKSYVLISIVAAAAKLGDKDPALPLLNDALKLIDKINDDDYKATALGSIAEAFIKLEDKDHALLLLNNSLKLIERFNDNSAKAKALGSIAAAAASLEDKDQVLPLLNDFLKFIDKINDDGYKATVLGSIATAAAKLKDKDHALLLLNNSLKLIERFNDNSAKAKALGSIAAAAASLEDKDQVLPLLNDFLKFIDKINDDGYKATVLGSIATAAAKLKDKDHALLLLNNSLKLIDKINDDFSKARALGSIAAAAAKLKDKDHALPLLNDSLKLIEKINNTYAKANMLTSIAAAAASLEDKDHALPLLNDSLKLTDKINQDSSKATALGSIAAAAAKLGDKKGGQMLLNDSFKIAEKINDDSYKANAMTAIANAFAKLGEATKDVSVIKESFAIVEKVSNDSNRQAILITITDSRLVFDNIKRLRSLASYFSSETSRAKALARILTVYVRPELVEKDKPEGDEESEDER